MNYIIAMRQNTIIVRDRKIIPRGITRFGRDMANLRIIDIMVIDSWGRHYLN